MKMIELTQSAKTAYPRAKFGAMVVRGLGAKGDRAVMDEILAKGIEGIKSRHCGYERKVALATEPLCHYAAYYKRFDKSYPVLGQLESIVLKGRGIPSVGIPIEAMFLAEVANLLLTAGYDLDMIKGALTVDVVAESTTYIGMSGKERPLVKGDLYLSDAKGALSSILNGPDHRTRITEATRNALYFVYGVEGVTEPSIDAHLKTISSYLSQAIQGVEIAELLVF